MMTIASRMLFARRPRSSRTSSSESQDVDVVEAFRRQRTVKHREFSRQPNHRHRFSTTHSESESIRLSCGSVSESGMNGSTTPGITSCEASIFRLARNNQLPAAVVQARARLLQRLGCVSPTMSRQYETAANAPVDASSRSNDFSLMNARDHEYTGNSHDDGMQFHELGERVRTWKTPGLRSEAFASLPQEVFKGEIEATSNVSTVVVDCCICLDRFQQGDCLIRLHCGHRFHPPCLEPWFQTRADCPYCRARLVMIVCK